jgi:hypothetical protein
MTKTMTEAKADAPLSAGAGPDFMCVGLQKGGTRWLYDQLDGHEDFWMPPKKELHYFDDEFPKRDIIRYARKLFSGEDADRRASPKRGGGELDAQALQFYAEVLKHPGGRHDLEAYKRLFSMKGDKLSGDVTPGYSTLDAPTIEMLAKAFPKLRICLLLRDPVSRLWSHWRMRCEKQENPEAAEQKFAPFERFIQRPSVIARSYPSQIAARWSSAFGDRFRYFFLEDVSARPEELTAEIVSFLGGDPAKPSTVGSDFNRKAKTRSAPRSPEVQTVMRRLFEEERAICAKQFGGAAEKWPDLPY